MSTENYFMQYVVIPKGLVCNDIFTATDLGVIAIMWTDDYRQEEEIARKAAVNESQVLKTLEKMEYAGFAEYDDEADEWVIHDPYGVEMPSVTAKPAKPNNRSESSSGFVYVLTNESLPYIKVGYTTRTPEKRCEELSKQTGLPTAFDVEYSYECKRVRQVEAKCHELMSGHRVNSNREFFDVTVDHAASAIYEADMEVNQ